MCMHIHVKQFENEKLHNTKEIPEGHSDLWYYWINLSSIPQKYLQTGFDDPSP